MEDFRDSDTPKYYANVVLLMKKLLLDTSLSDLTIKAGGDSVLAHAGIVACRCEEILPLTQDEKSKKRKKHEVKLKDGVVKSGPIMQRILEYLYTGSLDFPKLSVEEMLYVNLGAKNLMLARLVYLCEKWIKENLSMENVYHYLKASSDLKEDSVKQLCMNFALEHYVEFISNKNDIQIIGIDLFQEVVAAFNPATKSDSSNDSNPVIPKDSLIRDLKKLYQTMGYADSHFNIGDTTITYHKYILVANSEIFSSFVPANITAKSFAAMLKFLYFGEEKIDVMSACELVDIARKFKLHTLTRIVEEIAKNNISNKSVLSILQTAYLPASEGKTDLVNEIKGKTLPFILDNIQHIDLSSLHTYPPMMAVDIVLHLQETTKEQLKSGSSRRKSGSITSSRSTSVLEKDGSRDSIGGPTKEEGKPSIRRKSSNHENKLVKKKKDKKEESESKKKK